MSPIQRIVQHVVFRPCGLFVALFLIALNSMAFAAEDTCGGTSTLLYADDTIALTICHGPYTRIDRSRLDQWQNCDDAMFYIKDKKHGKNTRLADCLSEAGKQFRLRGDAVMLRHFCTTYPEFGSQPLLIETVNLKTNSRTYAFEKQFSSCTRKDIEKAAKQVDSTAKKPFDGNTYFTSVYGGLYQLRDCAKSDPGRVLSILRKYKTSGLFDGEVAETLGSIIGEVELIHAASIR